MQIKKFVGDTSAEIMSEIRKEFGEDAMILQTNTVKTGGFLGFFQKEKIEILAALDDDIVRKSAKKDINIDYKKPENSLGVKVKSAYEKQEVPNFKDDYLFPDKSQIKKTSFSPSPQKSPRTSLSEIEMKRDLDEIKTTISSLSKKINETFKTPEEEEEYQIILKNVKKLQNLGISEELSNEIINTALKYGNNFSKDAVFKAINEVFSDYEKDENLPYKNYVFIGSTGVGKTTTLAKLASEHAMRTKSKIGFMTLDTYRISAVEQLRTYAQILSAPLEVSYETKDVSSALQRLSNRDVVYIDTAGRSHRNKRQIVDLRHILDTIDNKKIYLVLSANTTLDDIYDIIKVYEFIDNYSIIITKLDETSRQGKILDIIMHSKKPIAYTTHGQNVPDDIMKFDFRNFTEEILKEY